jgi:hypothetical protein
MKRARCEPELGMTRRAAQLISRIAPRVRAIPATAEQIYRELSGN